MERALCEINWMGQITGLPSEVLQAAGLQAGDVVEVRVEGSQLVVARSAPGSWATVVTEIPSWSVDVSRPRKGGAADVDRDGTGK